MKFKSIVIIFNSLVLFFLTMVFSVPFFVLGKDFGLDFWRSSWFLAPILAAVVVGMDVYFAVNFRVFVLLEKEDWPALVQELEEKVLHRGKYSSRLVRLLINAYLVLSEAPAVNALEKKLAMAKPALIDANALIFGAARILAKDNAGAAEFFSLRGGSSGGGLRKTGKEEWMRWYYAFALLLDNRAALSADRFMPLAAGSVNGIITGLSAYFLSEVLVKFLPNRKEELLRSAAGARDRVKRTLKTKIAWNREFKRVETEVYVMVLNSYIGKAADYIYSVV